jgi:hypothetical protein
MISYSTELLKYERETIQNRRSTMNSSRDQKVWTRVVLLVAWAGFAAVGVALAHPTDVALADHTVCDLGVAGVSPDFAVANCSTFTEELGTDAAADQGPWQYARPVADTAADQGPWQYARPVQNRTIRLAHGTIGGR